MLRLLGNRTRCCDGVARRTFLTAGALGVAGLSLADLLRAEAEPLPKAGRVGDSLGRARACIILYLYGAPSQLETFDMKPEAPADIRGEFRPIRTSVPGLQICEHLPRVAQVMHRVSLIRSMTHEYPNHAVAYTLSGIPFSEPAIEANEKEPRHWPYLGSVLDYVWSESGAQRQPAGLPTNLILPWKLNSKTKNAMHGGLHAAWLGSRYDPVVAQFAGQATRESGAPSADGPAAIRARFDPYDGVARESTFQLPDTCRPTAITLDRLHRRCRLLAQFDAARRQLDRVPEWESFDRYQQLALSLTTSSHLAEALDVRKEPAAVRARYGMTLFGQGALTARRLIEAGVRLVTLFWDEYGPVNTGWDTHVNHFPRLREGLLPGLDQVYPALLEDLRDRGLLEETVVLCISEHGRTPRISAVPGGGREHWAGAYCGLFAGAGVRAGNVIGATDPEAAYPVERPVSPKDVLATLYHLLGVDPRRMIRDVQDRLVPIEPNGTLIPELLA
jgi:hypothetical protein